MTFGEHEVHDPQDVRPIRSVARARLYPERVQEFAAPRIFRLAAPALAHGGASPPRKARVDLRRRQPATGF